MSTYNELMEQAYKASESSVARRLKVGAVLTDGTIMITGYNHMPKGYAPECDHEIFTDDYHSLGLESYENVIHAEVDLILKAAKHCVPTRGATVVITDSPCLHCAELLVEAGISEVIYDREYRITDGIEYLKKNNVKCIKLSDLK